MLSPKTRNAIRLAMICQEAAMEKLMGEQAGDSVKRAGPWPEMPQLYWDEGEVQPTDEADYLQSETSGPPSSA
jgi:hypothetical protein